MNVELPLFPGYLFCRFDVRERMPILSVPGVLSILGFGKEPVPIPESEIAAIDIVLRSELPAEPCGTPREGEAVIVRSGPLAGVEGLLVKQKNASRLVVSISMVQRSVLVEVDLDAISTHLM